MRSAALALIALVCGAAAADAEVIYLKNGNVVVGSIVGATADSFDVQLAGGKTTIMKDSIARIEYEPSAAAPMPEHARERSATLAPGERVLLAGLGAGIPLKSESFSRDAKADLAGMIEYFRQVTEHLGFGLSLDSPGFTTNYPSDNQFSRQTEVTAEALEAVGRYVVVPESRVSPIVEAGLGIDAYYQLTEATNKTTGAFTESHDTVSGLGAFAGTGVQFLFGRRSLAEFTARWHYLQADAARFGVADAQAVSLVASLGFRF